MLMKGVWVEVDKQGFIGKEKLEKLKICDNYILGKQNRIKFRQDKQNRVKFRSVMLRSSSLN